jgi:hypothetical protein
MRAMFFNRICASVPSAACLKIRHGRLKFVGAITAASELSSAAEKAGKSHQAAQFVEVTAWRIWRSIQKRTSIVLPVNLCRAG